jgi:type VI protein secretion system component VasF
VKKLPAALRPSSRQLDQREIDRLAFRLAAWFLGLMVAALAILFIFGGGQ